MITITGTAEEIKKVEAIIKERDCRDFSCTAKQMRLCMGIKNPCPYHYRNIRFEKAESGTAANGDSA